MFCLYPNGNGNPLNNVSGNETFGDVFWKYHSGLSVKKRQEVSKTPTSRLLCWPKQEMCAGLVVETRKGTILRAV